MPGGSDRRMGLPVGRVWLSGAFGHGRLVKGHVSEHGEQDVAAAPGEDNEGLVAFALGAFPVVVGAGSGVLQR